MFLLQCLFYFFGAAPDPSSHFREIRKERGQGSSVTSSKEREKEDRASFLSFLSLSFSFFSLPPVSYSSPPPRLRCVNCCVCDVSAPWGLIVTSFCFVRSPARLPNRVRRSAVGARQCAAVNPRPPCPRGWLLCAVWWHRAPWAMFPAG